MDAKILTLECIEEGLRAARRIVFVPAPAGVKPLIDPGKMFKDLIARGIIIEVEATP